MPIVERVEDGRDNHKDDLECDPTKNKKSYAACDFDHGCGPLHRAMQ